MIRSIVVTVVVLIYLQGCGQEASGPKPEQLQRMLLTRDTLKETLGNQYHKSVPEGVPEQLKRGNQLYQQVCAPCHGVRGKGDGHTAKGLIGTPTDFTDAQQALFYSEQARVQIIRKGIAGTPMMGWEKVLTEEDIMAVYLYIRSLIDKK